MKVDKNDVANPPSVLLLITRLSWIAFFLAIQLMGFSQAHGACSAATDTWVPNAGTNVWGNTANWDRAVIPGTGNTDNAYIRADWFAPTYCKTCASTTNSVGCLEINSGSMNTTTGHTLNVTKDYFRNLNAGSLIIAAGSTFTIGMLGTAAQTFENLDPVNYLTISNAVSVELTQSFIIRNSLTINAGAGLVYVDKTVTLQNAAAPLTIPSSATVEVKSGGVLIAPGGITVNGVLKIDAGGQVKIGNGKTLQVPSGGIVQLAGASGNIASIDGDQGGSRYAFTVAGSINANNFAISRTTAAGVNVTGTIQTLSNGDFHYLTANGYAVTLANTAVSPSTWSAIGFYDDANTMTAKNINASAYAGGTITLNNWAGLGGAANANDPGTKLSWGTQAGVQLQVSNATASGNPPATIAKGAAAALFGTFGFSLTGNATATDITSVKITLNGSLVASDINYIQVFKDADGNCLYNAGTDAQVGGNLTVAGTPPTATITLPAGAVSPSSAVQKCMHVLVATNSTAQTNDTFSVQIASTADVVNSGGYNFSNSGGPPVSGATTTITGTAINQWNGGNGTPPTGLWTQANNWTSNAVPTNTTDCQVGNGYTYPRLAANQSCQNMTLPNGGTLDWNSGAWVLSVYGGLTVGSSYTFLNAASGVLQFAGSTNQSVNAQTTWPGSVTVNSTGGTVSVDNNMTINGSLTLTAGTLSVSPGYTLKIGGAVNINGGVFILQPGASLALGNGSVLTVGAAGTLQIVGNASQNAGITSTAAANAYTVVVNGTLKARYYSFDHLGLAGVTINSGATIDATNFLQNGNFSYPVPNNTVLLTLNRLIPGNALPNVSFDAGGSAATGVKALKTNANGAGASLTFNSYSGSLAGAANTTVVGSAPSNYPVIWASATTTIDLTQDAAGPASVNQGQTYTMGRFAFKQTQAGTFTNTGLTSVKITLTGTGTASDVTAARLYYDSGCTGSTATLLGTASFSGNPATANFTSLSGAVVDSSVTAPPKRCVVVQYDVSSSATNGATLGVSISSAADVVNSQTYSFSGAAAPPVTLGTAANIIGTSTTWSGAVSTDWYTAGNWNGGSPTSALNCVINSATRNPIIGAGTATCKNLTIGNGTLTMTAASGAILEIYGAFNNTGTFVQNSQTVTIRDNGVAATNQTVSSSSTFDSLTFNKVVAGGSVVTGSDLTVNALSLPSGQNFTLNITNGYTLNLPAGITISAGVVQVDGGGTLQIGSGQSITVNGGQFKTAGSNDAYPQVTSTKALMTRIGGSGTWSFTATSGTVDLTGFLFDWLDVSGLNISGTTTVANLNGGQLRNLSTSYSSVKAIQLNTTGSIPGTASNVGWNWGPSNTPPSPGATYNLASSTGCSSQTISFDQWFGDFFVNSTSPNAQSKVSASGCTINISAAASPVTLTQFIAVPYDSVIALNWSTGLEWDHQGFNVYRSYSPDGGYAQLNDKLIRNTVLSGTVHGNYQFYDNGVRNGVTYYYMIEDFSINGTRTLHGPVAATALALYGPVPAPSVGTVWAQNVTPAPAPPAAPGPGIPLAPGQELLAPNVVLLAKTNHSLRIRIDVPAMTTTPVPSTPYMRVAIPDYSSTSVAGRPELPERIVMVDIPPAATASGTVVSHTESTIANTQIAPAPQWTPVNGALVSSWALDSAFYALNQSLPATPFELGQITQSQGRTFLPIVIHPLAFNPVTHDVVSTSQIIFDVALDGKPIWNGGAGSNGNTPWALEGGLKIGITSSGIYQITYNDLVTAGVDGPFKGVDVTKLRLFIRQIEIPMDVTSASGFFGPGDSLRFYAPFINYVESAQNNLILIADTVLGLRMTGVSGDPTAVTASNELAFMKETVAEQNLFGFFSEPYAENLDHIFWGRFFAPPANAGDDVLTAPVDLPGLVQTGDAVSVQILLKGSRGSSSVNAQHHLKVFINQSSFASGDFVFSETGPYTGSFTAPAALFNAGHNQIRLQAIGDLVGADYDVINLDKMRISYPHTWAADADFAFVDTRQPGNALTIGGFTEGDISIYDVSNPRAPSVVNAAAIGADGAGGFQANFATTASDPDHGIRFSLVRQSLIPKPFSLELAAGSSLSAVNQGADALYIGPASLLDAVKPLADLRSQQGFRTKLVDINSVFAEFGDGVGSAAALKAFIQYASTQWQAPGPRYVVLVGDGTYDPRNALNKGISNTIPIHLVPGAYNDYASDNWFVAFNPGDDLPSLSIGRIPGRTPELVTAYVNKVLSYESGAARPQGAAAAKIVMIADKDQLGGEQFAPRTNTLAQSLVNWNNSLSVSAITRDNRSDADFKTQILSSFNAGPMIIHYFGHGAEDRWAGGSVFTNADATQLTNPVFPIVVSMNCLNTYFYDADPAYQSLGDSLLFNEKGGAIAVWGSTSLTNSTIQSVYQDQLYQVIAQNPGLRLGEAVRMAKVQAGWATGRAEVLRSWTLLGDPLISINTPAAKGADSPPADRPPVKNWSASGCGMISDQGDSPPDKPTGFLLMTLPLMLALIIRMRRSALGKSLSKRKKPLFN